MASNRRVFITTAAATAAGAAQSAHAKPKLPESDFIRVGVMALGDNSHMNYQIWAPMFNLVNGKIHEKWPVGRSTNMIITHCWDRDYELAKAFAKEYGCTAVKNYDDMVGEVDAVMVCEVWSIDHWYQLSAPYLRAGIPVFFNRPFSSSMKPSITSSCLFSTNSLLPSI